jgi:hypothetical protein
MYAILQLGEFISSRQKDKGYVVGGSMIELRNVVKRYKKLLNILNFYTATT